MPLFTRIGHVLLILLNLKYFSKFLDDKNHAAQAYSSFWVLISIQVLLVTRKFHLSVATAALTSDCDGPSETTLKSKVSLPLARS